MCHSIGNFPEGQICTCLSAEHVRAGWVWRSSASACVWWRWHHWWTAHLPATWDKKPKTSGNNFRCKDVWFKKLTKSIRRLTIQVMSISYLHKYFMYQNDCSPIIIDIKFNCTCSIDIFRTMKYKQTKTKKIIKYLFNQNVSFLVQTQI